MKTTTTGTMASRLAKAGGEWAVEKGEGYHDGTQAWNDAGFHWVRFTRDGVSIALNITKATTKWDRDSAFEGLLVEGHTCFDGRCFTRHGIDSYSCRLTSNPKEQRYDHAYADLAALLAGEYERCLAARKRSARAVPVPGLPFHVQPEWFATAAGTLRSGRTVALTPAGFGTGYMLSIVWRRGSRDADPELRRRLGFERVYIESFDHD